MTRKARVCIELIISHPGGLYLSLVVLHIEEGVIVGQFDHLEGMVCGFVNDGQVEKPAGAKIERERERGVR